MKNKTSILIFSLAILFFSVSNISAGPISGVDVISVVPPVAAPGSTVAVTFRYDVPSYTKTFLMIAFSNVSNTQDCNSGATTGQYFVTYENNQNGPPVSGYTKGYDTNDNGSGGSTVAFTWTYNLTVPSTLSEGMSYFIIVGAKDYSIDCGGDWTSRVLGSTYDYISFSTPPPMTGGVISKTVEATTARPGDYVLHTIDYNFANANSCQITDAVPANCTLISQSLGGTSGGTAAGSGLTWNIGNTASRIIDKVWYVVQINSGTPPGTVISDIASWSLIDPGTLGTVTGSSADAPVMIGPDFSFTKSENVTDAAIGDTVTYTYDFNAGGLAFWSIDNFDSTLAGFHTVGPGPGFTNGGGYVASVAQAGPDPGYYPHLLRDTPTNFCFGDIQGDVYIESGVNNDALIAFRDNNLSGAPGCAYGVGISTDGPDGDNNHRLWIQKYCTGIPGGAFGFGVPSPAINVATWYTIKIHVTDPGNGVRVQAKVWVRGTAEPGAYTLDATDVTAPIPDCGYVGFQAHRTNGNRYDNLKIDKTTMSYPVLYDTLPTELTYIGGTAADITHSGPTNPGGAGTPVLWKIFTAFTDVVYHMELWAVVNYCGTLLNKATLDTVEAPPTDSNTVSMNVTVCPQTATFTETFTYTPTKTASPTSTFTSTATPSATPSGTPTATQTATPTYTATPTATPITTLVLTKSVSPLTAGPGDTVSYNIHIESSNVAAAGVNIWDTLPNKHLFSSISPGGTPPDAAGVMRWTIPSLPTGAPGVDVWFIAYMNNNLNSGETYQNTAYASSAGSLGSFASNMTNLISNVPVLDLKPVTNYPNPFAGDTTILFTLTVQADCSLKVYTISGELIRTIPWAVFKTLLVGQADTRGGENRVRWDGLNDAGNKAATGIYFYRIDAKRNSEKKFCISKLAVLR